MTSKTEVNLSVEYLSFTVKSNLGTETSTLVVPKLEPLTQGN